jgi:hypothetical protein
MIRLLRQTYIIIFCLEMLIKMSHDAAYVAAVLKSCRMPRVPRVKLSGPVPAPEEEFGGVPGS